jgi:hypothetical protein
MTPPFLVEPLLQYIPQDWVVYEPCSGEGNIVSILDRKGYYYRHTDIMHGEQYDFLTYDLNLPYDVILTNPPYRPRGMIDRCLRRCHDLGKPFALLVPFYMLRTASRLRLLKQLDVQFLVFTMSTAFYRRWGKSTNFVPVWVCHRLLPERLMWV